MKLEVHTDAQSLRTLREQWTRLLADAGHNSIFATSQWAETWWRSFGEGRQFCLLSVWDEAELAGLVPLFVEREGGRQVARFLGGIDVTDYEDIVAQAGREHDVWAQAVAYLDQQPWEWDLHNVPGASPTIAFFRRLADDGRHVVSMDVEDVCPLIDPLPSDWETYLGSLSRKDRHELRRKLRRLMGDSDVGAEISWQSDDLEQAMDDFIRLHRLSSPDKADFMQPRMVQFFKDVATMCQERGWLCLGFLSVNGERVSTIMAFAYDDTFYLYNSGYDPQYEYLSVGLLLKALTVEHAINKGMKRYDFLQGSERYKYDLGGKDTQVYHIHCRRKG